MAGFFVCLSIPILIFILVYNYYRNSETIIATLHADVAKTRQVSIENVEAEKLSAMTLQASQRFEAGDFPAAERAYRDILKEFPEDALARLMMAECSEKRDDLADVAPERA
jgi:hypothetical protein